MNASPDLSPLGIAVGHATDDAGATGLTVVRGIDRPLRASSAIFGRATGSRELHAASAEHSVDGRVDAVVLTGGSAYGLDAVGGVMRWMEERGRGYSVGGGVVPIVPAAVVFDLAPLGRFDARPTPQMAYDATQNATSTSIAEGSVGGGTGTTVGKVLGPGLAMKGGFGCATEQSHDGALTVAAMAVVNAFGDVRDASGKIIAGARGRDGGFVDTMSVLRRGDVTAPVKLEDLAFRNTTIALVATSAPLSALELNQLARAAGAALFRRITPAGSLVDGDIVFAVSPEEGARWSMEIPGRRGRFDSMIVEALAVSALERAIERAVRLARGRDGVPGLADDHGH
ncbi:MAG TPA: P1 family peptidase [Gemmatimonadaceae bacterium]